jgi:hypothetical protein
VDFDGLPDECGTDCNNNGIGDAVEIAQGLVIDCNVNYVPDECDNLAGLDCNENHVPDSCDIAAGAPDCNNNGLPDTCDVDANLDGIADACQGAATPFCFGNGAGGSVPCPCSPGGPGNGCPNSYNAAGANLSSTGLPSRIADSLTLLGSGMPPVVTVLFLQGSSSVSGFVFGDGVRCTSGTTIRLGYRTTSSTGSAQLPEPGGVPIHTLGVIPTAGAVTRYYQNYYRDSDENFCTVNRFNFSNAIGLVWLP